MICVTTRFRLKQFWMLLPIYLTYRWIRRDPNQAPGLIRYAFPPQSSEAWIYIAMIRLMVRRVVRMLCLDQMRIWSIEHDKIHGLTSSTARESE